MSLVTKGESPVSEGEEGAKFIFYEVESWRDFSVVTDMLAGVPTMEGVEVTTDGVVKPLETPIFEMSGFEVASLG